MQMIAIKSFKTLIVYINKDHQCLGNRIGWEKIDSGRLNKAHFMQRYTPTDPKAEDKLITSVLQRAIISPRRSASCSELFIYKRPQLALYLARLS